MAHLVEHLIFAGSKNYPEGRLMDKLLRKKHGKNNANTGNFLTTYYFEVMLEDYEDFLDYFVDALFNPLFRIDDIKTELVVMNSEIAMRLMDEKNFFLYSFLKDIGVHESKLFNDVLNHMKIDTIDFEQLQARLVEFHQQYYSTNNMKMVIISDHNGTDLIKKAENGFKDIEDKKVIRSKFDTPETYIRPFTNEVLGSVFYRSSNTDLPSVKLLFPIATYKNEATFHPVELFCILFKYFVKGSFYYTLMDDNLVTNIKCYNVLEDYNDGLFMVRFFEVGTSRSAYSEIILRFFEFVNQIRHSPNITEIFESISKISKYTFMYNIDNHKLGLNEQNPDYWVRASKYSQRLFDFPLEELFRAENVYDNFDKDKFNEFLDKLTLQNLIILVEHDNFKEKSASQTQDAKESTEPGKVIESKNPAMSVNADTRDNGADMVTNTTVPLLIEDNANKSGNIEGKTAPKSIRMLAETQTKEITAVAGDDTSNDITNEDNIKAIHYLRPKLIIFSDKNNQSQNTTHLITKQPNVRKIDDPRFRTLLQEYFDNTQDSIVLDQFFSADNPRPYFKKKISDQLIEKMQTEISKSNSEFLLVPVIDTSYADEYMLITKCDAPEAIQKNGIKLLNVYNHKHFEFYEDDAKAKWLYNLYNDTKSAQHVNSDMLYKLLFTPVNNTMDKSTELAIHNMIMYKYCLMGDFIIDTSEKRVQVLVEESLLTLWYKLYRRDLQPKFITIISIQSLKFLDKMMQSPEKRRKTVIHMDILCQYFEKHMELHFYKYYLQGNDFRCKRSSFELELTFSGITNNLLEFIIAVATELVTLSTAESYDRVIFDSLQSNKIQLLTNFKPQSAKRLAMYYLDHIIDILHIDYSNDFNASKVIDDIKTINMNTLANLMGDLDEDFRFTVFNCGNISKEQSLELYSYIRAVHLGEDKKLSNSLLTHKNIREYLKKLSLKFNLQEHMLIRVLNPFTEEVNSVYLTYFKVGQLDKKEFMFLKVAVAYLKDKLYNYFRNNLGIGYIATAFYVDYHYVS